jgi:hypothetical protein
MVSKFTALSKVRIDHPNNAFPLLFVCTEMAAIFSGATIGEAHVVRLGS